MATVRAGNRSVMMVVDMQVGVIADAWDAHRIVGNVARSVERARAAAVPVIWVQHDDDELRRDSPAWQLAPELVPAAGEPIVHKRFNSSFEATSLETELAQRGATRIVLAGAATNWCIRATAYGALDRGYDLTLVEDAHTTTTMQLDDGVTIDAATLVRDLNIAMRWLSYPGRQNAVARADAVDFVQPGAAEPVR